ncbi:hypothetical protein L2E82_07933 [Cichorium intybus]|uniref:Uncharacterized protein n=1 Tax=Cichorium intybus TaxID=13427 RepID=A0ACB9G661_CICIN|nr:hypothetical protein L2E82_07933 [Cichorium intybus]
MQNFQRRSKANGDVETGNARLPQPIGRVKTPRKTIARHRHRESVNGMREVGSEIASMSRRWCRSVDKYDKIRVEKNGYPKIGRVCLGWCSSINTPPSQSGASSDINDEKHSQVRVSDGQRHKNTLHFVA